MDVERGGLNGDETYNKGWRDGFVAGACLAAIVAYGFYAVVKYIVLHGLR